MGRPCPARGNQKATPRSDGDGGPGCSVDAEDVTRSRFDTDAQAASPVTRRCAATLSGLSGRGLPDLGDDFRVRFRCQTAALAVTFRLRTTEDAPEQRQSGPPPPHAPAVYVGAPALSPAATDHADSPGSGRRR